MNLGLEGRTLICTGAAGGIGRPTAETLAREGARLLLVDSSESVIQLASQLPGSGHQSHCCDLRRPEAPAEILDAAGHLGDLHGLVHLAAVMKPRPLEDIDTDYWDLHHEVNVRASFLLAQAVAPTLEAGGRGSMTFISSGAWLTGGRSERLAYAASKGAVTTLVRGLARTLGPRGIRVNAVAPGMVDTPMMHSGIDEATRQALEQETPLGRFADPQEVANVVAFVASPAASFVSGATFAVTGGHVLH